MTKNRNPGRFIFPSFVRGWGAGGVAAIIFICDILHRYNTHCFSSLIFIKIFHRATSLWLAQGM